MRDTKVIAEDISPLPNRSKLCTEPFKADFLLSNMNSDATKNRVNALRKPHKYALSKDRDGILK